MQLWGGCGGCSTLGGRRKEPKAKPVEIGGLKIVVSDKLPPNAIEFHHPDGRIDRFKIT